MYVSSLVFAHVCVCSPNVYVARHDLMQTDVHNIHSIHLHTHTHTHTHTRPHSFKNKYTDAYVCTCGLQGRNMIKERNTARSCAHLHVGEGLVEQQRQQLGLGHVPGCLRLRAIDQGQQSRLRVLARVTTLVRADGVCTPRCCVCQAAASIAGKLACICAHTKRRNACLHEEKIF
jgi:hypothetical protein